MIMVSVFHQMVTMKKMEKFINVMKVVLLVIHSRNAQVVLIHTHLKMENVKSVILDNTLIVKLNNVMNV